MTAKYSVIDPETGVLDPAIFSDEAVYRDEMEKVFGRAWLLVGHVSLVPNPGDFFHTYMGEDPVILTRHRDGGVGVMLNMCRHRGARLVRFDDGNCDSFMCAYHGWTYGLDGALEYVPGEQEAYDGRLDKSKLGLRRARVETYAGLVFATWADDAPSLEAYLGDARWYLDALYNHTDAGMVAQGPHKWVQPINWKTAVDNCTDWYHVPTTHVSASNAYHRVMGMERYTHKWNWENTLRHAHVNGHQFNFGIIEEGQQGSEEARRRLGDFRADHLMTGNFALFPNVVLGFRLAIPRGPLKTEFWHFSLLEADAPEEVRKAAVRDHAAMNGVAGTFEADDIDNWRQVSESGLSARFREQGQLLNMGIGNASTDDRLPGLIADRFISESNHRSYYLRWQEFMNAESWADISLEPVTADYAGTAGMGD